MSKKKKLIVTIVLIMVFACMFAMTAAASAGPSGPTVDTDTIGLTSADLTWVLTFVVEIFKIALPVILGFIGFRKGISFLMRSIRGA